MSNLRRYDRPGDHVFIACKTIPQMPILVCHGNLLKNAFEYAESILDVKIEAWVILPDHFHAQLILGEIRLAQAVKRIKEKFARSFRSIVKTLSGRIWQHRYWDHIIRDEDDWRRHIDYIHYNPVKHRYTDNPFNWSHSSLQEYLETGMYEQNWRCDIDIGREEFGE